jgi:GNAT superfamily N-acetyltransferase
LTVTTDWLNYISMPETQESLVQNESEKLEVEVTVIDNPLEELTNVERPSNKDLAIGMVKAYDLDVDFEDNQVLTEQLHFEYGQSSHAILATVDTIGADGTKKKEIIGSFSCLLVNKELNESAWMKFIASINGIDPTLANTFESNPPIMVRGVWVNSDYRRKGVAMKMLDYLVETLRPTAIIGTSKSPQAVALRQKLDAFGYQTWYDGIMVSTDTHDINGARTPPQEEVLRALLSDIESVVDQDVYYRDEDGNDTVGTDYLSPEPPDTSNFPEPIQKAFEKVIARQEALGNNGTAVAPLISMWHHDMSHASAT